MEYGDYDTNYSSHRHRGLRTLVCIMMAMTFLLLQAGCSTATPTPTATITLRPTLTQTRTITPRPTITQTRTATLMPTRQIGVLPLGWEDSVSQIVWVAYTPPSADPNKGIEAKPEAIRADLARLREAKFTGLVTYSSTGVLGRDLPVLAQELGFKGLIMGIWDPASQDEMKAAESVAKLPIIIGYCIGNEGLNKRYKLADLSTAIEKLRQVTGKPVTTTEEFDDYQDENLLNVGDWVFPNAHPYFHNRQDATSAVRWTLGAYDDLTRRTIRFVLFKEVGLPTAGDALGNLSENDQAQYYLELAKLPVHFVYFEAFDEPWKTDLPIEPYWGIFQSNRAPKLLGWRLMGIEPTQTVTTMTSFYVYKDADFPENHFKPTGYMGDTGDIRINEAFDTNPHSGKSAIRVIYEAQGKGPSNCDYPTPMCKWAGAYWLQPPNNWGKDKTFQGKGYNLSSYNRLKFWARADKPATITFQVGGIDALYGDSLNFPRSTAAKLTNEWQEYEIKLNGANLNHIIGGFAWVTNWDTNPGGATFYLDDIRFEK
jgi:exo-beta-1,3-glucanase (GH17 family)